MLDVDGASSKSPKTPHRCEVTTLHSTGLSQASMDYSRLSVIQVVVYTDLICGVWRIGYLIASGVQVHP